MRIRLTGLWRHPDFVRLWAGQTVSLFGSLVGGVALEFTAILWLAASPLQVSVLAACRLVPAFLAGPVAGVWVDRVRRRPLLIAADAGRAVALATIPVAALFDVLRVEQLYLVAVVTSTLNVFFEVAYEAYLPSLVGRGELVEGNGKLTASASVAEFSAFSVGGWLVQLLTAPAAVLVDAASFVWSAAFVAQIRAREPVPSPHGERRSLWREAREGMRVVVRRPLVRTLAAVGVASNLSNGMIGASILLYLSRDAGFSPGVLGVIFGVGGVTSLFGALLAGRTAWFGGLGRSLGLSKLIICTGGVLIPLVTEPSLLGVSLLVTGQIVVDPAWSFYSVNEVSLRQAVTPDRLRGRMNASLRFLEFGAMLLGTFVAGLVGGAFGLREAMWLAAGTRFVAVPLLVFSPVFALRHMPPDGSGDTGGEPSEAVVTA